MSNHRVNSEMDSKVLAKSGSKRKRDYRYLSLLGASLFSISLMQLNTTTVHADTTATSQATVVKSQAASSNAASETTTTSSVANSAAASTTSSATVQAAAAKADSVTTPSAAASSAASNDSSASTTVANTSSTASAAATAASSAAADSQAASSATSSAATASNLVVIKNGDSSVQLDNQLKISVDSAATLKKVTSNNTSSFTYDDATNTVTISNPSSTDTVTAEYGNVGTYLGQAISAQMTISNIVKHTDEHPTPSNLATDDIQLVFLPNFGGGIKTYNVGQDEVTIKFFDQAGNQVAINGDGYITVGSLNGPSTSTAGNEYINYDDSANATYITESSVVKYQTNPLTGSGNAYVGISNDFTDVLGAPTSENGAVTFQLSGNVFTFLSGTTRYTLKNANHHWSYTLTTFSSATVAPAVIPTPVLAVDKSSAKAGDTVTYTLDQQVNTLGEDTMLRYQSWSEVVTLPTEVSYQQANLLDSTGNVIADATITWDENAHQLTVTLPEDYLQNTMTLDGETYQVKMATTVNGNVINGEVGSALGQVTIDNGDKSSNNVSTVYVAPVQVGSGTSNPQKAQGKVIVTYQLEDGMLIDQKVLTGEENDKYTTVAIYYNDIYTLNKKKMPSNSSGKFSNGTIYVTYIYSLPTSDVHAKTAANFTNVLINGDNNIAEFYTNLSGQRKMYIHSFENGKVTVQILSDSDNLGTKMIKQKTNFKGYIGDIYFSKLNVATEKITAIYTKNGRKYEVTYNLSDRKLTQICLDDSKNSVSKISRKKDKLSTEYRYKNNTFVVGENTISHKKSKSFIGPGEVNMKMLPQTNESSSKSLLALLGGISAIFSLLGLSIKKKGVNKHEEIN